jgi:hypothetical protein
MNSLRALLLAPFALLFVGCPQVQIVEAQVHSPEDCILVVHSKVSDLSHVADRCKVVAEFGNWRGVGTVPMVRRVAEPQDVYSEIRRWEKVFSPVAAGQMRVRFFYVNELLAQQFFPAPDFPQESLERQQYWPDEDEDWPESRKAPEVTTCPGCGNDYPQADARFCGQCGRARPGAH